MSLRVAFAQYDFPVGAIAANRDLILALIAQAREAHCADLIVFPELCLSGYSPEDLLFRPQFLADCRNALIQIAAETRGIAALVGWPECAGDRLYNTASVLRDGAIELSYRKRDLPNYSVFDEKRYFHAPSPAAPGVVDIAGVRVGLLICQDLWGEGPLHETAAAGAELVVVPNASPFECHKHAERIGLLARRSQEGAIAIGYVNVVGGQDDIVFDGGSLLADSGGHVHDMAMPFEAHLLVADFEPSTRSWHPHVWPAAKNELHDDAVQWNAIVLGTRDYCRKNGFDKVLLGLSGGIDSSLVLAIAVDAFGAGNVTAVRMPSRYTAQLSNDLAAEQCRRQGVHLLTLPIEKPFVGYLDTLNREFAGREIDATEENLQSRIRGAILMALSNKFGALLLTTGNKSEYAVGYATIYGDMCGGYAPIKDVYKTEVFRLARWRNTLDAVIPSAVIDRPPTAELRENQTDQDALPPYEVLDAILKRFVDDEQSCDEIVSAGFEAATVEHVLRLVRLSEWKRHQAAPGPKVTRRAFGRERRYPITNEYR